MTDLSAKVAVVTGASSGIGEATAKLLIERGIGKLVLVARREERLRALASTAHVSWVAVDLTEDDAPAQVLEHLHSLAAQPRLDLLINNAGASRRSTFAAGGWANVRETMALNFDAQLRLTEALLPLLRESAPSAIVNVTSTAGRVSRAGTGAYSASKAALGAWSDALFAEEHANGVHVATVLPGFISTEGFPQQELVDRRATRWAVSTPEHGAQAIVDAGLLRQGERFVPRGYWAASAIRVLFPSVFRRTMTRGAVVSTLTTRTGADERQTPR